MRQALRHSLVCVLAAATYDALVGHASAGKITTSRPFLIDSTVADMQWVNSSLKDAKPNAKTVFVRSTLGSIYRSRDDGKNWVSQRDKFGSEDDEPYKTRIQQMIFSKADARYAIFKGYSENIWYTKDQGDTYQNHAFGVMMDIKTHSKQPEWLLASKFEGSFPDRYLSLFLSVDFGASWKKLVTHVYQFEWADPTVEGFTDKTIFASVRRPDAPVKNRLSDWDPNIDFVVSHDFFENSKAVVKHGNRFALHDPYWFVAAMNPQEELEVTLHVSNDKGKTFLPARFPYQLSERSYRVVDSKEGSVFVQVSHGSRDREFANVYMSGSEGRAYTLSLRTVVKDYRGLSDFERINGGVVTVPHAARGTLKRLFTDQVDGVYVANVADEKAEPELKLLGGLQAVLFNIHENGLVPTKTKVTFDKGGKWQPLAAPKKNHKGEPIECEGCSLHLNGKTSGFLGPVYSSASSTGLIMATGNVGHHLHSRQDEVNTYFSRDAGRSWEQIAEGSYIYEFGDHGALMIMANNREATNEILYSWNEGLNWTTFQFWEHHIEVENIITEPTGTSQIFIVYGRRHDKGALMQLNFETMHERRCAGVNAAGSDTSDYEQWVPADDLRDGACLMGRKVKYTRRKRAVQCFNGWDYDRKTMMSNCPCTRVDFECDFGYQVAEVGYEGGGRGDKCTRVPDMPMGLGMPDDCNGYFTVTKGYRKVPGDTCQGGQVAVELEPRVESCPGGRTAMVIILVMSSLVVVFAWFTYVRRKEQGMPDPWNSIGDCIDFVKHGAYGGSSLFMDNMTARYTGLADGPDDDDDFGLGDDDDEAKVLGESLHEYALGVTEISQAPPLQPGGADLISIDSGENGDSTSLLQPPRPLAAPPAPSLPVPTLAPPPPRK